MKQIIAKILFFIAVFSVSLFLMEKIMNQGDSDLTTEMSAADIPLVYMVTDGETINCLHGYLEDMNPSLLRDTVTPLDNTRDLAVTVEKLGLEIKKLSYQVRSCDGQRLVEENTIIDVRESDSLMKGYFTLKDLIDKGKEYNFILVIDLADGRRVKYYTRILPVEEYHLKEKAQFVRDFSAATFRKEAAKEEIGQYLETSRSRDNSTLAELDIKSSFKQVTWGDLDMEQVGEAVLDVQEIDASTASMRLSYMTKAKQSGDALYAVTDYYRVRYSADRMYLLSFERKMDQLFDETSNVFNGNKISAGIQNENRVQIQECDGGDVVAFVIGNRLFSYNASDNKLAYLFGFRDADNLDARTIYDHHRVKILDVEESGTVKFAVYGYMNRGRHEGSCGIQVMAYDSNSNTLEELVYIPEDGSADLLIQEAEAFCQLGNRNQLYLLLDESLYQIETQSRKTKVLAEHLQSDCYTVSEDGRFIAWVEEGDAYSAKVLSVLDTGSGQIRREEAPGGCAIRPIGFAGSDLIYGLAYQSEVGTDENEVILFPMHKLVIQDEKGKVLKTYEENDTYVMGCEVESNRLVLTRAKKGEDKNGNIVYNYIDDDQIMSSKAEESGRNYVETVTVDTYQRLTQIALKNTVNTDSLQVLTPKEVLFEGDHQMKLPEEDCGHDHFYVYDMHGLVGRFTDVAEAVSEADRKGGAVRNENGEYIWVRTTRVTRNQIMKITGTKVEEGRGQLAACLDAILEFEGVNRSTQFLLDSGMTPKEILESNLSEVQVLELTGCSLEETLYYVNQDIPVLVQLAGGEARLVTGFNEVQVVLMDPVKGTVYKVGMNDTSKWLEENGNRFITYMYKG